MIKAKSLVNKTQIESLTQNTTHTSAHELRKCDKPEK